MLFQFVFVNGQSPFCLKMADFSDFGGCCKFWQVAAKPSSCFKTFKIDQWMWKYCKNASRKCGIDRCFHLTVEAICSNLKCFCSKCCMWPTIHPFFDIFGLGNVIAKSKDIAEVFATQRWYRINERNMVTYRSGNQLRIRMSWVRGWPDCIQNSTACTFLMIYQQKRYQWIWETSMIHSSLLHHEILIWACYQESLVQLYSLAPWRTRVNSCMSCLWI